MCLGVLSEKTPYGNETKTLLLIIEAHSKTHDSSFIDVANSLAGDIVTGLFRSTTNPDVTDDISNDLGGLVNSIKYLGHDPLIGQGQEPFCGTVVRFEIIYETSLGNMGTIT